MKTLTTLTAALLIIISFGAMADDSTGTLREPKKTIAAPACTWGSPEDLNTKTVEQLKYLPDAAPAMEWGTPEDLNEAELQTLKVRANVALNLPAFSWGSPEDLDMQTVNGLKHAVHTIKYPEIVIGDPAEIDASDLKSESLNYSFRL